MKLRLTTKLPAMIAAGAALTAVLVAGNDYFTAANFLERQVVDNLKNVRNGRKAEVFRFLSRVHEDLEILAAGNQVRVSLRNFHHQFRAIARQDEARAQYMQHLYNENVPTGMLAHTIVRDAAIIAYGKQHDVQDKWFRHIVPARSYGDLYLISHDGDVVYSVLKKDDFASNLVRGRWKDTGLAKVFRGAMAKAGVSRPPIMSMPSALGGGQVGHGSMSVPMKSGTSMKSMDHGGHGSKSTMPKKTDAPSAHAASGEHAGAERTHGKLHGKLDHSGHNAELFQDISQYLPDHGAAAGFMAVPVIDDAGYAAGILAVRFPIERVNDIMQEGSNLGDTGDAYLVGEDFLFRSQPRFETASFVIKNKVRNAAVEAAFAGKEGVMETQSYDDGAVLAAYGSIEFHGTKWAIISEMDLDEIHIPTEEMRRQMLLIGGLLTALMILAGIYMARTVTVPLSSVTDALREFGMTRKATTFPHAQRTDEIGETARAFSYFVRDIEAHETELRNISDTASDAIVMIDGGSKILSWNTAATGIFGHTADAAVGQHIDLIIPDHLRSKHSDGISRIVAGGGGHILGQTVELEGVRKSGDIFPVELSLAKWENADGPVFCGIMRDITDRKQAEEALRVREERIRALLEVSPIGFALTRQSGEVLFTNVAFRDMLDLPPDPSMPLEVGTLYLDQQDRERYLEQLEQHGEVSRFETQWKRADGAPIWVTISGKLIDYDGDQAILAWIDDITMRKMAEAEIARKEAQLSAATASMSDGLFMLDADGVYEMFNENYLEFCRASELDPDNIHEGLSILPVLRESAHLGLYGDGDRDALAAARFDGIRSGDEIRAELRIPNGDWYELRKTPRDVGGCVVLISNITERKRAEQEIARQQAILETTLETMEQGISMIDADLNVVAKNSMFMELLQFPPEKFPGDFSLQDLFRHNAERGEYGDGDIEEQVQSRMELSRNFDAHQFERTRSDGTVIDVRGNPLPDKQGFVTTYTDITERVLAAKKLGDAYDVISSSINYASRIQKAILADEGLISAVMEDYFIIWEPRDVVGGDIYWAGVWGDGVLILIGDCTGHGVPGAFMTLISMGALERSLQEVDPGDPGGLIRRMHQHIQITLRQQAAGGESDDGIELGLSYFVPGDATMTFAGARFELYVTEGDDIQMFKGAKKGVGYRGVPYDQVYKNTTIDIKPGHRFYMTTDGLIDQIGGARRRSFGKRRFRDLLKQTEGLSFADQQTALADRFAAYQGDEPRRDDVCVIGFTPLSIE